MKILVTDASIFIDLHECDAYDSFFKLPYEIITTYQVWHELDSEHHTVLSRWVESEKLTILKIEEDFVAETSDKGLSKSLSVADLSVWFACDSKEGILLTSDGALRKMARRHGMETHGLLWIFKEFVDHKTLTVAKAVDKLEIVFNQNIYYRSDQKLIKAFEEMKKQLKRGN
jgi:predicted nucleic acid-binding protein